ncbi:MAG: hypothetical protein ACK4MM_05830 [Fervidobacterium sp.]
MRVPNFTVIFILAVFLLGLFAIIVYEHFRYSPFALMVDFDVIKEYIFDRHVECYNPAFRNKFRGTLLNFKGRLNFYEFALSLAPVISIFEDNITRVEIPVRKVDKILPLEFKYVDNVVVVSKVKRVIKENESFNESLLGAHITAINGIPIENILERYSMLYPNLPNYEAKYAFVEKMLPYFLKIIGASSVKIDYKLPNSSTILSTYVKGYQKSELEDSGNDKIIDIFMLGETVCLRVYSFNISKKEDLTYVSEELEKIAYQSNEHTKFVVDLRYAKDGDETLITALLSYLISEPKYLYPKLYVRYKDRLILKEQMPIISSERKIRGKVYFIVDRTCFYQPHKVLLGFLSENPIAKVISTDKEFKIVKTFYTDEFWRILPNTRTYIVFPTSKVVLNTLPKIVENKELKLLDTEVYDSNKYEKYVTEKLNGYIGIVD